MAGSVTWTEQSIGSVKMVKAVWTASATGFADDSTTEMYDGQILAVATVPGDGVTLTQPTNLYDIDLVDSDGVINLAMDNLDDRSNTTTEFVVGSANLLPIARSTLGISIANAGNGGQGTIYFWIR